MYHDIRKVHPEFIEELSLCSVILSEARIKDLPPSPKTQRELACVHGKETNDFLLHPHRIQQFLFLTSLCVVY